MFCAQEKFDEAQRHYERAIALRPGLCQAHSNLGNIFGLQRRFDEAVAQYLQALALNPNDASTHHELGKVLKDQGHLERALASFDRALALVPHYAEAHYNRSALKTFAAGDPDLAVLESLAAGEGSLPADKMCCIHFALGKALDDVGQYDRAFQHWLKANALKRQEITYDESIGRRLHQNIARAFTTDLLERFAGAGDPSPVPIFVLGMPRSGSTLVEQILASHPQVHGAGELTNLGSSPTRRSIPSADRSPFPTSSRSSSPTACGDWARPIWPACRRCRPARRGSPTRRRGISCTSA